MRRSRSSWDDRGYPADRVYRDYHARASTGWSLGKLGRPYDRVAASDRAREHAADFVARVNRSLDAYPHRARVARTSGLRARHRIARSLVVRGPDTWLAARSWRRRGVPPRTGDASGGTRATRSTGAGASGLELGKDKGLDTGTPHG